MEHQTVSVPKLQRLLAVTVERFALLAHFSQNEGGCEEDSVIE